MKASFLKILSLISGVLLVFSGMVSIFNWFGAITSVSMILGLAMLIAGAFSMLLALAVRGDIFGAPWLMRDGVLSVVTCAFALQRRRYHIGAGHCYSCDVVCLLWYWASVRLV